MMESSLEGTGIDPSKCSKMSVEEKRELVYELSKRSDVATEMLQSWSRQEILQILCAEMGKERKYTGLTKVKIIEALLKIVSEKRSRGDHDATTDPERQSGCQRNPKRQRKTGKPSRFPISVDESPPDNPQIGSDSTFYCKNLACRAVMRLEDLFCKRCSCCICHKYDDNKDPSLWLTCSSEPPFRGEACGMSCHLECALKSEKSGIGKNRRHSGLDGSFFCVSCGKVNDLFGCWRKQMKMAKDTRRVDILCYRIFLGQKLLKGTKKYQKVSEIVDEASQMLQAEVGPLTGVPGKMSRGIVNRLPSGPDVQKLCSQALEALDKVLFDANLFPSTCQTVSDSNTAQSTKVRFEDIRPTSLAVTLDLEEPLSANVVGFNLWYRKVNDNGYSVKPSCSLYAPNTRHVITDLTPSTEYCFKVVPFDGTRALGMTEVSVSTSSTGYEAHDRPVLEPSQSPVTNCSSLSNPSSVEDESNNIAPYVGDKIVSPNLSNDGKNCSIPNEGETLADAASTLNEERAAKAVSAVPNSDAPRLENGRSSGQMNGETNALTGSETPVQNGSSGNNSEAGLPITPCRSDIVKDCLTRTGRSKPCKVSGSAKSLELRPGLTTPLERNGNGASDMDFEHCVKVIRSLECSGHIEKNFRQKFLTWYSLRATQEEVRVVKVFIDTFADDPASLAEQLVDTFGECVSSKRAAFVPGGFCLKLWH